MAVRTVTEQARRAIVDEALEVIARRHAETGLSVDDVARELAVSRRSLQRALADAGLTFRDELAAARVRRAQRLLRRPRVTVRAAARMVGVPQPAHFAKRFRDVTGMTPSQWRQQHAARSKAAR